MSEGTRVGIPTNLKISEPGKGGPKLRFTIEGMKCVAWPTVKDGGVEIANPCIPAIKAAANEYPIAFDGWESIESDWTDQRGNTHKGKAQIAAQRLVEASQSIYGEVFQDYYGIDAMGNKVQGGGVQSQGEGAAGSTPPTPPGWAETPPGAVGDPTVGSAFSGGHHEQRGPSTTAEAHIETYERRFSPPDPVAWLNSSYESPYLAARKLAVACVFKAYDFGGDSMLDEWTQPDENVNTDKPRILARMVHAVTESLVRGEL